MTPDLNTAAADPLAQPSVSVPLWNALPDVLARADDAGLARAPAPLTASALLERVELAWALVEHDGSRCDAWLAALEPLLPVQGPAAPSGHDPLLVAALRWRVTRLYRHLLQGQLPAYERAWMELGALEAVAPAPLAVDGLLVEVMGAWQRGLAARAAVALSRAARLRAAVDTARQGALAVLQTALAAEGGDESAQMRSGSAWPPEVSQAQTVVRAMARLHEATWAKRRGQPMQALSRLGGVDEALVHGGYPSRGLWARLESALLHAEVGDVGHALELSTRAVDDLRAAGWPFHLCHGLMRLGEVYLRAERPQAAEGVLREALGLWRSYANAVIGVQLHLALAQALETQGQLAAAVELALQAADLGTQARLGELCALAQARAARSEARRGDHTRALALLPRTGLLDDATLLLQLTCWEAVAAMLARPAAEPLPGLPATDHAEALQRCLHLHQRLGTWSRDRVACLDALAQVAERQGDTAAALRHARAAREASDALQHLTQGRRLQAVELRLGLRRSQVALERAQRQTEAAEQRAEALDRMGRGLRELSAIGRTLTAHRQMHQLLPLIKNHLKRLMPVDAVLVLTLSPDRQTLELLAGRSDGQAVAPITLDLDDPVSLAARCARERRMLVSPDEEPIQHRLAGTRPMHSALFQPLMVQDELVGVFSVQSALQFAFGPSERALVDTLSHYVAIAIDNARAWEETQQTLGALRAAQRALEQASVTDPLTGLWNRRYLELQLPALLRRCARAAPPADGLPPPALQVLLLDLDHFKRINDTHGHPAGDAVLRAAAQALRTAVRPGDQVLRWGGEEFLVVAPGIQGLAQAEALAERLRAAIASTPVALPDGGQLSATTSVGWALHRPDAQAPASSDSESESEARAPHRSDDTRRQRAWEQTVQQADAALYAAKKSGRNCTAGWS